jgi:hypothetical protein
MEIQEIISKLETFDSTFPREAIEAAIEKKEEIIPELIEILRLTTKEANEFRNEPDFWGHIYAMLLLAQFKEKQSYQVIFEFFSLPDNLSIELLETNFIGLIGRVLASVAYGDMSLIRKLIENKDLNNSIRYSGIHAYLVSFLAGQTSREEIISYYHSLYHGKLEREPSIIWDTLIDCSIDLYPKELSDEIEQAYRDDLVTEDFIPLEEAKGWIEFEERKFLTMSDKKPYNHLITDAIKEIEYWPVFRGEETISDESIEEVRRRRENNRREPIKAEPKIGRNEPCPCGSGKKYKKCCGKKS